jgi:pyruvate/2-oxoglutarate/acetoin dehydrogenase E1 component
MERCAQALNRALHSIFEEHPEVYLIGEDVLDPYGGAFKVAAGLSTRWPQRVLATPISEAAITGVAAGMALRGLRPVVEIMFGDFITLALDQLANHVAKFAQMYNGQASCPIVVRTPMGGRRGYGPTHSQSLEKLLLGVPGLVVLAPSRLHRLDKLLTRAVVEDERPVVFIENKQMYGQENTLPQDGRLDEFQVIECRGGSPCPPQTSALFGVCSSGQTSGAGTGTRPYPTLRLSLNGFERSDVTLATYGGMAPLAMDAAMELAVEEEIFAELVIPSQLSPLPIEELQASVRRSGRLVVAEEGTMSFGWGAEVVATMIEAADFPLAAARVGAQDSIIPSARILEDMVLPQTSDIVRAVHQVLGGDIEA